MLCASDRNLFVDECQMPEIKGLRNAGVFKFKNMSKLPSHARLLNAIWSYCPDGVRLKHKSHIRADGWQQKYGMDYWEMYAPVVHWSTVRMVLVLSALLNLKSCQVNYTQAFSKAPLEDNANLTKMVL
jgi:hypothetical protein